MAPSVMKAVVTTGDGKVTLKEVLVPKPKPTEVLVKVVAVGENPVDCTHFLFIWNLGCVNISRKHCSQSVASSSRLHCNIL
jgi:hypothetical protein